jgi:hypothetical protein
MMFENLFEWKQAINNTAIYSEDKDTCICTQTTKITQQQDVIPAKRRNYCRATAQHSLFAKSLLAPRERAQALNN